MAGGVGSRLYPISTPEKPKQFLDLLGVGKTLIQLTYERFLAVDPEAHFWVVTSAAYHKLVREQLPDIPDEQILLEPVARNTAPCIAYVSWKIARRWPDARVAVAPSDAYVPDVAAFAATLRSALDFVAVGASSVQPGAPSVLPDSSSAFPDPYRGSTGAIVTVGITPDHPDTEYGYIHIAGSIPDGHPDSIPDGHPGALPAGHPGFLPDGPSRPDRESPILKVSEFKEKPSLEVAERYLAEGGYFWNAGIFVYGVQTMIDSLRAFVPGIADLMDRLDPSLYTASEQPALEELFPQCEKISIDYAVMERSSCVYMAPATWAWSDLGSFAAIEKVTGKKLVF